MLIYLLVVYTNEVKGIIKKKLLNQWLFMKSHIHYQHRKLQLTQVIKKVFKNYVCVWQLECSICRVCPKIFMEHIWPIFDKKKKNTHTHEKSAIVIWNGWKENFPRYLHWHIVIFQSEKFTRTKKDFLWRFVMGNVHIFSPSGSHSEYLGQFFNLIILVCCNTKSR